MCKRYTDNTERRGVNAVESIFLDMDWVFRETPHTDYGIDGDVEIRINGILTGQHIALQIKSGDSYLKENKDGKITFYIDEWHYRYWLQYDRPVIILFYDEIGRKVIWEQVKLANIQNTPKRFKIEVNPSKILSISSLEELQNIVAAYEPHRIFNLDNACLSQDYLKYCIAEISRTFDVCMSDNERFNEILDKLTINRNNAVLHSAITHFAQRLQFHNMLNYEFLHKASWVLNTMSKTISHEYFLPHNMAIKSIMTTIDGYIKVLNTIKTTIDLLILQKDAPEYLRQDGERFVLIIDDGIAAFLLVKKEYEKCLNNVMEREQRQLPQYKLTND